MKFCFFLLFAGVADAALTQFGINSGIVEEGNPLMRAVIEKSWAHFYLIKIFLPFLLIGLCYLRPLKGRIRTLLVSACVLYVSVLVYHMGWILFYFNTAA